MALARRTSSDLVSSGYCPIPVRYSLTRSSSLPFARLRAIYWLPRRSLHRGTRVPGAVVGTHGPEGDSATVFAAAPSYLLGPGPRRGFRDSSAWTQRDLCPRRERRHARRAFQARPPGSGRHARAAGVPSRVDGHSLSVSADTDSALPCTDTGCTSDRVRAASDRIERTDHGEEDRAQGPEGDHPWRSRGHGVGRADRTRQCDSWPPRP